jgi:hypothetical protein
MLFSLDLDINLVALLSTPRRLTLYTSSSFLLSAYNNHIDQVLIAFAYKLLYDILAILAACIVV